MALTYQSIGTVGISAANGTSVTPTYPSSIAAGDNLILVVFQKPSTADSGTVTTPGGWTSIGATAWEGGYGATLAADAGNTKVWTFSKDTVSGSESGTLSVTVGTNNVCSAYIIRVTDGGGGITYGFASGGDSSSGSPVSVTCGSNPGIESGDLLIAGFCEPTDVGVQNARYSSQTITATSATIGTVSERADDSTLTGTDFQWTVFTAPVSSGTASAAPVLGVTISGTNTNSRGPGFVIRMREGVPVHNASAAFSGESSQTATAVVTKVASAAFSAEGILGSSLKDTGATEAEYFEAGTDGGSIGGSTGIFDTAADTGGAGWTYSDDHPIEPTLGLPGTLGGLATIPGGGTTYRRFNIAGSDEALVYFRTYMWIPTVDVAGAAASIIIALNSANTNSGRILINESEQFRLQNGSTNTGTAQTGIFDQHVRIEWKLDRANSLQTLRLFYGTNLHGTVPDVETTGTYDNTAGTTQFRIGQGTVNTNAETFYHDGIGWSLTNWVGPITVGGPIATVTAGGGPTTHNASASFSAASSLTATGAVTNVASASFSAQSSLTSTGVVVKTASASFSAQSSLGGGWSDAATEYEWFDSGTDGASIGTTDLIFDGGVNGSTSTVTYDNDRSITGNLSMKIHAIGTEISYRDVTISGSNQNLVHWRQYLYIPTVNVTGANLMLLEARALDGTTRTCRMGIAASTELLRMQNGTSGVGSGFDMNTLYNGWVRIEWKMDRTNSLQYMRLFYGANLHGTTPDFEESAAYTTGSGFVTMRMGAVNAPDSPTVDQWIDAVGWKLADWVGPVTLTGGPEATVTTPSVISHAGEAAFSGQSTLTADGTLIRAPGFFGIQM